MNCKISVIVPVYNVREYLPKCLDSIINQTYTNLEILLVDDGSSDGSELICDEYATKDKRIKVIHQKNKGVSVARNAGIDASHGEFIYFSDSDDYLEVEMMERMIDIADGADIIICNFYMDYVNKRELFYREELIRTFSNSDATKEIFAFGNSPIFLGHLWHKLFKSNIVSNVRFDSRYAVQEDMLFVLNTFINASIIRYTSFAGYHYVQRINSMMYSKFSVKTYSAIEAVAEIYATIKVKFPLLSLEAQSTYLISNLKQASLCVYSNASLKYLKQIRKNILEEKPYVNNLKCLSIKERIYFKLLCVNTGAFILFYKIFIEPNRRRYERKLEQALY